MKKQKEATKKDKRKVRLGGIVLSCCAEIKWIQKVVTTQYYYMEIK